MITANDRRLMHVFGRFMISLWIVAPFLFWFVAQDWFGGWQWWAILFTSHLPAAFLILLIVHAWRTDRELKRKVDQFNRKIAAQMYRHGQVQLEPSDDEGGWL